LYSGIRDGTYRFEGFTPATEAMACNASDRVEHVVPPEVVGR
jgi:hypothetical protein